MKKLAFLGGGLILASSAAMAADDGFKSSVEVGLVLTSGNTETRSGNLKAKVEHTKGKMRNTVAAEALYVEGKQGTLSEKYLASGKSAYQFGEKSYGLINGTLDRDLFSGYDYQATLSAGYGYRAIDTKKMTLDLEAGPGYRQNKLDNKDAEGELIGRASGLFAYRIAETSTFTQELVSEFGSEAVISRSVTAITAQIVGNMAMKASLTAKHNSNTPTGKKALDTETALTLVYNF